MSSEVHIMCDVCRKTIYKGDKPGSAENRFEEHEANPRPMHATPPPGDEHGSVRLKNTVQELVEEVQTCSLECTRKATNEMVDRIFRSLANFSLHEICIAFTSR